MLDMLVEHCSSAVSLEGKQCFPNKIKIMFFLIYFGCFIFYLVGSYFWGVLADKKGRKPVLISSGICMGLSMVAFGFSVNIWMAIVTRFLVGFFNGKLMVIVIFLSFCTCCGKEESKKCKKALNLKKYFQLNPLIPCFFVCLFVLGVYPLFYLFCYFISHLFI